MLHLRAFASAVLLLESFPPTPPVPTPWLPPLLEVLALQCLPYHPVSNHMVLDSTPRPPSLVHLLYPEHTSSYIGHFILLTVSPFKWEPPKVGSLVLFMPGSPAPNTGLE